MFTFLLVVQAVIAFALVTVILMQRSEGGGLGMGGSPSGLMSARGAADFLTRATTILATLFVGMSIVLAVLAATQHRGATVDTSLVGKTTSGQTPAPDAAGDALSGAAAAASNGIAPVAGNEAVPLAQ
ncbi:MAG: preprotein translocase subunit SecG [Sphingomonadales bacterium]|nr:preprotein translocase subunit SecG [Sphingomonadales bacterium]